MRRKLPIAVILVLALAGALVAPAPSGEARRLRRATLSELADPDSIWTRNLVSVNPRADLAQFRRAIGNADRPLHAIYLKTMAAYWGPASDDRPFLMTDLQVDGRPALHRMGKTVIEVPLRVPVPPGGTAHITLGFRVHLPEVVPVDTVLDLSRNSGGYGVSPIGAGIAVPVSVLPQGFLGREYDEPAAHGVILTARDRSLVDFRVTVPAGWDATGQGPVVERKTLPDGRRVLRLAMLDGGSVFLSAGLQMIGQLTDGCGVTVYYPPGGEAAARRMLDDAVQALAVYQSVLGPGPFREHRLVPVPLTNGVAAWSGGGGTVVVGLWVFDQRLAPVGLRFTVFHELAHAWWGHLAMPDPRRGAWWGEGLADATAVYALEQAFGPAVAEPERARWTSMYRAFRRQGIPDWPLGRPIADPERARDYALMSYSKPAIFYDLLRREVGNETFFAAMRRYIDTHRFVPATDRGPVEELLAHPVYGERVEALWQHWMLETHGDADLGV